MKEEMTSFDIAALTPELNQTITGARIDNIYQTNPITLLLKLRQPRKPSVHLLIEAGRRLHLTSYVLKKLGRPPAFSMALRKHLRNGKIKGVRQHEFERVLVIQVSTGKGDLQLVAELFGRGNIILVNPQNRILQALTYRRMRDRNVLRGESFQHAPPHGGKGLKLKRSDLNEMKALGQLEIVRALTKSLSIGGLYAEEILLRAGVSKDTACDSITKLEMDRIHEETGQILSFDETGNVKPGIVVDEQGAWIDVIPMPLQKYARFKLKAYGTVNEALDEYYTRTAAEEKATDASEEIKKELAKQERILQRQEKALEDSVETIEHNSKIGDMIYSHFNELQIRLQEILSEKGDGRSWKQIVASIKEKENSRPLSSIRFHSLQPERLTLNVSVNGLTFPLNIRHSIQDNASSYYRKAKRIKKKLDGTRKAIGESQTRIDELRRQRVGLVKESRRKLPPMRRKKAWYEKFRWFHSSDGFLVLGGRDATTNELLIKKHMEPNDVVFHADLIGAPFVLIKTRGKQPSEQTINESAQLAAAYSRAWKEMLDTVNVYWVSPQQVKKRSLSLARGAFVIRGSKNYVRNVPLQIAVGIKMKKEHPIVIGGPSKAIAQHTDIYLEVIPGKQKSGELAEHLRRLLAKKLPEPSKKRTLEIPLEEIQRFIPLGRGKMKP